MEVNTIMIICGFQGIGKSTIALDRNLPIIDLESSAFKIDGKRCKDWEIMYAQVAQHLSKSNNIVLTSCHAEVRDAIYKLSQNNIQAPAIMYPSIKLRNAWLERLFDRYRTTRLEKDKFACQFAKDNYIHAIEEINKDTRFDRIVITDINYSLNQIIQTYVNNAIQLTCLPRTDLVMSNATIYWSNK